VPLRRELLDRLSEQLVRRTFVTCDHVLRELGLRPADIDAVLMAGGSTHLPAVQRGVEAYFGRPGRNDVDPIEVVALGAALETR
jgi:molecular chaperone DnaK